MKRGKWMALWLLCAVPAPAFAWAPGGHEMIAVIALARLNPHALSECNRLLSIPIQPAAITTKRLDFVSASVWADEVRRSPELSFSGELHYIDQPFSADGTPLPSHLPKAENVVSALTRYVAVLRGPSDDIAKAQALRFVLHFEGDIHQPLHGATRVSVQFPEGDQGGNLFPLGGTGERAELHAYWDGGLGAFPPSGPGYSPPPLVDVEGAAREAVRENPESNGRWRAGGPFAYARWARESFELAKKTVYAGIAPGDTPSRRYRERGVRVARRRIAWAGYRLAALLNAIWPAERGKPDGGQY